MKLSGASCFFSLGGMSAFVGVVCGSTSAWETGAFWPSSEDRWVEAGDLKPGMTLLTDEGTTVIVTANHAPGADAPVGHDVGHPQHAHISMERELLLSPYRGVSWPLKGEVN